MARSISSWNVTHYSPSILRNCFQCNSVPNVDMHIPSVILLYIYGYVEVIRCDFNFRLLFVSRSLVLQKRIDGATGEGPRNAIVNLLGGVLQLVNLGGLAREGICDSYDLSRMSRLSSRSAGHRQRPCRGRSGGRGSVCRQKHQNMERAMSYSRLSL